MLHIMDIKIDGKELRIIIRHQKLVAAIKMENYE